MEFLAGNEKRFFDFISSLSDKDRIALLSHNDADGITSAVLASKVIGKTDYIGFLDYSSDMLQNVLPELKRKRINKVILTDISADSQTKGLEELVKARQVLVIDHHKFDRDLNSEKLVYIKAKDSYPASFMCYHLFSKIQNLPGWLAALGTLGDMPHRYTKDNAHHVFSDFGIEGQGNLFNLVQTLSFALIYFKGKEKKVYDILMRASSPEDVRKLEKQAKAVETELNHHIKDFESRCEEHAADLVFYDYKPRYSINSMLVNTISVKDKSKTYVFVNKAEELRISCRRQDGKVDCARLMKESVKGLPESNAGGHHAAAGARTPLQYFSRFKENLIRAYSKMKNI